MFFKDTAFLRGEGEYQTFPVKVLRWLRADIKRLIKRGPVPQSKLREALRSGYGHCGGECLLEGNEELGHRWSFSKGVDFIGACRAAGFRIVEKGKRTRLIAMKGDQ